MSSSVSERYLEMVRTVFSDAKMWWAFEHGTVLIATQFSIAELTDAVALEDMKTVHEALGPYGGEGSYLGDCYCMRLREFPGYLIGFARELPMMTYVEPEEVENAPPPSSTEVFIREGVPVRASDKSPAGFDMRVALIGRAKRNLDLRDRKIVARSTDR